MELWLIIIIVIVGVLSVFSILFFTGVIVRPRRDGIDIVLDYLKKENADLVAKIDKLERTVNEQSAQIHSLQMQVVMLESKNHELPYASWTTDAQNVLTYGNPAFENIVLKPNRHLLTSKIGKSINSFLDEEAVKQYIDAHDWVLSNNRYWEGVIQMKLGSKSEAIHVVLYPNSVGNRIVSVSGMIIPVHMIRDFSA